MFGGENHSELRITQDYKLGFVFVDVQKWIQSKKFHRTKKRLWISVEVLKYSKNFRTISNLLDKFQNSEILLSFCWMTILEHLTYFLMVKI